MRDIIQRLRMLIVVGACLLSAVQNASAQFTPVYEKPKTKLDLVWQVSKMSGFAAAEVDAITTSQAIRRGYVESSHYANRLIDRSSPALAQRSALQLGEAYGINLLLNYAYKHCDTKLCKIVAIAGRGYFTGRSVANSIHNVRLP